MTVFKCKMCGGDLNVTEEVKVIECDYCGTSQTVATANNEKKVSLFNRANRLRMMSDFDKAAGIYENIIAEFPEEAEAYWGLCLCEYGIEYVDDPATGKKIPTCHRAAFEKISENENYNMAIEFADVIAQKVYRDEARAIDRIMGEILSVSKNEKPYDVFICYKETDEKGERTADSVLAQDIYDTLTSKGMKVFFARISLEDKLGQMYEPYIFAGLNSAKVMLVVGTKYEYIHAVWVKNEWSRFLKLIAKDKSKVLIPCYKDMDAYDLPNEFKFLQAQDMSKIGFMQDLVRGVEKIVGSATVNDAPPTKVPNINLSGSNIKQLIMANDVMYEGEVFADIPHGFGKAIYSDGVYEGEWYKGIRKGQGKFVWDEGTKWAGDVYEGQWVDDKRTGLGKYMWSDGGEWIGEFRDYKMWNGNGVVRYDDCGDVYEGKIENGQRTGQGKYIWGEGTIWAGDVYEGQWVDGKRTGLGKYIWAEGGEWIGKFRDDEMLTGNGLLRYDDGDVYEGKIENGQRTGQGKYIWIKGGEWNGEFRDGKPWNGNGVWYFGDKRYEGVIKNGKKASGLFGFKFFNT